MTPLDVIRAFKSLRWEFWFGFVLFNVGVALFTPEKSAVGAAQTMRLILVSFGALTNALVMFFLVFSLRFRSLITDKKQLHHFEPLDFLYLGIICALISIGALLSIGHVA